MPFYMLHTFRARRSFYRLVGKSRGSSLFIEIIGQNLDTINFITKNKVKKSKKIAQNVSRLRIVRASESLKKGKKVNPTGFWTFFFRNQKTELGSFPYVMIG